MNIYMKEEFLNQVAEGKVTPICPEWICSAILTTTRCKKEDINNMIISILNWNYKYIKELKRRWAEELNKLD